MNKQILILPIIYIITSYYPILIQMLDLKLHSQNKLIFDDSIHKKLKQTLGLHKIVHPRDEMFK